MYNQDILNKILDAYGLEKTAEFCEITAMLYDIKYNAAKTKDPLTEFDFERIWWRDAAIELTKELNIE